MTTLINSWKNTTLWQRLGLLLAVCSYGLLYPGVTQPIMTISASMNMFGLSTRIFHETRSIWETVETLHRLGYTLVAIMIVTFSVVIPVSKALLIIYTWLKPSPARWRLVATVSKWSMADVFVVAILVAFFTAKATAELEAELLVGFYWFTAFCLLSIVSGQLLAHQSQHNASQTDNTEQA